MARVWRCGSGPAGVGCGDTYRAVQQAKSNGNAPALHSTREIQRCGRAPKCRYIKCALDDRPAAQQPTPCTRAPRPKGGGAARRRASTRQPLWQRGRAGEGVRRRHLDLRHLPGGTHTMSLITFTHVLSSHSLSVRVEREGHAHTSQHLHTCASTDTAGRSPQLLVNTETEVSWRCTFY